MSKRANNISPRKYLCTTISFPETGKMHITGNSGKVYLVKNSGMQWFIMTMKTHRELHTSIEALQFIREKESEHVRPKL